MGCCGDSGDPGAAQRQLENERQARIQQGLSRINATFGGGTYGTGQATSFDPRLQYYDAAGKPVTFNQEQLGKFGIEDAAKKNPFLGICNAILTGGKPSEVTQQTQLGNLYTGRATSPGFNDAFFNQRKQDYLTFATPELANQAQESRKQLAFTLGRQGLLSSGAAEQGTAGLNRAVGVAQRGLVDTAQQQENELRQNVEQERSRLINQLNATGDPNIAAQGAVQSAANLRLPSTFAPVGSLFQTFAQQYVNRNLANLYNQGNGSFYSGVPRASLAPLPATSRNI